MIPAILGPMVAILMALPHNLCTSLEEQSPQRDPFAATPRMFEQAALIAQQRKQVEAFQLASDGGVMGDFKPTSAANLRLPRLQLRGFCESPNGNRRVLLEVEGSGSFTVEEGDTVSVQRSTGNLVLRIEKVMDRTVFIDIGTLGQTLVVR